MELMSRREFDSMVVTSAAFRDVASKHEGLVLALEKCCDDVEALMSHHHSAKPTS